MTTQALNLAQFVPPATPNVGDTVMVSVIAPFATEWGAGGGGTAGVPEAPNDATTYGRRSLGWSNVIDAGTY